MTETPLDKASAAMQSAPDDDAARMRFFDLLASTEVFLLLETEAQGDTITPKVLPLSDAETVLAFDRIERLASFAGVSAPYASLSGRALTDLLAGQQLALGLNMEGSDWPMLLPPEAMVWLAETLARNPQMVQAGLVEIAPPKALPETLLRALDGKLAGAVGLARAAWLACVRYDDGRRGHVMAFVGTAPGAERALAQAVNEALVFSSLDAGELDVTFLHNEDPLLGALSRHGLRFDLPTPDAPHPVVPGSDPAKPPRLT